MDSGGKIFPVSGAASSAPTHPLQVEGAVARGENIHIFLGCGNWTDPLVGGPGRNRTGRLKTRILEIQAYRWT